MTSSLFINATIDELAIIAVVYSAGLPCHTWYINFLMVCGQVFFNLVTPPPAHSIAPADPTA